MKPESMLRHSISCQQYRMNPELNEASHHAAHVKVHWTSNSNSLSVHRQVMTSEYKD